MGQAAEANQALYEIITDNQARRRQWSKTYEGIMMRLMQLSVQLRKPAMVKEALHKYRAMCMQSNVTSLDDVVRALVTQAEKETEKARASVGELIVEGADDLEEEAMETPETLLLEAAGHPLTKERVDRQLVVPWMRFLWETYRVVLDIVKTHNKLETCYHEMATRAFNFCVKYKRYMEFRRLCDMLRQHLNQLISYPRNTPNDVKIQDSDTLQKFLETRFTQLSTAVTLEHWQEAYRTIEDIHMIMSMGKTKTRPQHMSIYYDKLMQVFWVSGNYLYHAHALYKLYTLSVRQNRNLSENDQRTMASKLLLAALSIPVYDAQSAVLSDSYGAMTDVLGTPMSENAARHMRMASLLGYTSAAERGTLISELLTKGVLKACHPELSDLYDILEGEMAPLQFNKRIQKILDFVKEHEVLNVYTVPVRRVAIFRLFEQLGRVYDIMRMSDVKKVAAFASFQELEDTALTALKTRSLSLRFDHQNQCLRFESELFSTDGMRSQLGRLARRMAIAGKMLTEKSLAMGAVASDREIVTVARDMEKKAQARRMAAITAAKEAAPLEQKKVLQRREMIERQKEEHERASAEIVRQRKMQEERMKAAARERQKREEIARKQRDAQIRLEKTANEAAARAGVGVPGGSILEDDAARELRLTQEKMAEIRQAAEARKKAQQYASHLNHVERAMREAQWDLLKAAHGEEVKKLSSLLEEVSAKELEDSKAYHERALRDQEKTKYIVPEFRNFIDDLMEQVDNEFDDWVASERSRLEEERAKEDAERRAAEEAERRNQIAQEEAREEAERKAKAQSAMERMQQRLGKTPSGMARTTSGGPQPLAPSLRNDIARSQGGPMSVSSSAGAGRTSGGATFGRTSSTTQKETLVPIAGRSKYALLDESNNVAPPEPKPPAKEPYRPRRFTNSALANRPPTRNTPPAVPPAATSRPEPRRPRFINSKKNKPAAE